MTAVWQDEDVARHWLLNRRAGWRAALLESLEESPCDDGLRLCALPGNGRPLVDPAGTLGGLVAPTGVAVDEHGHIYLIDRDDDRIKRYDPCCGAFERLPCVGGEGSAPRRLKDPHGIAVAGGRLYVADTGNERVQVFALHGLLLLGIWGPIEGWRPWGIAVSGASVSVTDYANGLVHRFTQGRWRWARDGATPGNPALVHPTHIAADRARNLYVAQEGAGYVVVLDPDGRYLGRADPPERLRQSFRPGPLATDEAGDLYVFDTVNRDLSRYSCCALPGAPVQVVTGACRVGAPVAGMAFTSDGDPLLTVPATGQVIHLEGARSFARRGRLLSEPLDSHVEGCQWHRVGLRGSLPAGSAVTVHTYTSELARDPEQVSELPETAWAGGQTWTATDPPAVAGAGGPGSPNRSEWDCAVLSDPGRYLWLRLTASGPGTSTPVIRSVEVHYPRLSSIQYLPAVYRSSPEAGFLDRLLSALDRVGSRVNGTLDGLPGRLEPEATPADFLSWLAAWVGLAFQGTWRLAVRRRLLRNAVRIYGLRGTRAGLLLALEILLGVPTPDTPGACRAPARANRGGLGILEGFTMRRWAFLGAATLGDRSLWGKRIVDRLQIGDYSTIGQFRITDVGDPLRDPFYVYAHRFTVFLPAVYAPDEVTQKAVEQMIELTKPAHTQHQLELVQPKLRIGVQATVGLDTAIARYPEAAVTGETRIGQGVVGGDRHTTGIALDGAVVGSAVL